MNALLQQVLAGVLVGACAIFSLWRLLSVRLRLRLLDALQALPGANRARWLARLRQRSLARFAAACGSCSHADAHGPTPDGSSRNQTPGGLRH